MSAFSALLGGNKPGLSLPLHPYFPVDLKLEGYQGLVSTYQYILGVFFAGVGAVILATWFLTGASPPRRPTRCRPRPPPPRSWPGAGC